jgi:hypothetical protein
MESSVKPITLERAVAERDHQLMFYAFCEELKALTRGKDHSFKRTVPVKAILELECRYAEADHAMIRDWRP